MGSKHRHTLEAVFANPVRANILWNEVIAMIIHYGGKATERTGSRVLLAFDARSTVLHRPHPGKEMKKRSLRKLRTFLIHAGLTP